MPLLIWDAAGRVIEVSDETYNVSQRGHIDYERYEASGGALIDIARNSNGVGAGTWPEYLPAFEWHEFTVEEEPGWSRTNVSDPNQARFRVKAIIRNGKRRSRVAVERRIKARIEEVRALLPQMRDPQGRFMPKPPVTLSDVELNELLGTPLRPLRLDEPEPIQATQAHRFPIVGRPE